tara:strand:- start:311 stop:1342 length:1032 start_codon:yes stop_codon:yes gene_type:complete
MPSRSIPFPNIVPEAYARLVDEPVFNPARHLALEPPTRTRTLHELGYTDQDLCNTPTPFAVAGPFRVLSDEGLTALRAVSDAFRASDNRLEHDEGAAYLKPRGANYSSRFVRDLSHCPQLSEFLSGIAGTELAPHSMPTLGAALVYAPPEVERTNQGWHLDSVGFSLVVLLSDPESLSGGAFQYFEGTTDEATSMMKADSPQAIRNPVGKHGSLPADRIQTVTYQQAGFGMFMQGYHILHRGQPLSIAGERVVFVPSFISTDVSHPDVTNWQMAKRLNSPAVAKEYVRHKAWRAKGRLERLIEALPFDEEPEEFRSLLAEASAELDAAKQALEQNSTEDKKTS